METITFKLGLILGLILPLILEKYFFKLEKKMYKEEVNDDEDASNIGQPVNYTPDLLEEWQTGIIKGSDDDE